MATSTYAHRRGGGGRRLLVLELLDSLAPDVDPVTRPVSEYALGPSSRWPRSRWPQSVGAAGPAAALRRERGAVLIVAFALLKLAMPLFPVDTMGGAVTRSGQVHNVLGNRTFSCFPWRLSGCLALCVAAARGGWSSSAGSPVATVPTTPAARPRRTRRHPSWRRWRLRIPADRPQWPQALPNSIGASRVGAGGANHAHHPRATSHQPRRARLVLHHPAPLLGAWAPGEATGTYRTGGDVLFTVAEGKPGSVSGADIATAVIDEIETPTQRRQHFTVAY